MRRNKYKGNKAAKQVHHHEDSSLQSQKLLKWKSRKMKAMVKAK
jgi:hypothetical protein